jgi:Family of unknown function (DUF6082)
MVANYGIKLEQGRVDMNDLDKHPRPGRNFSLRKRVIYKAAAYLATLLLIAGILSLVLISPLFLRQLSHIKGIDWATLSNVGQTYGAASAILSAIALIGVSLSLLVQARQARTERVRITRERHMELLQIILDDPDVFGPVIGIRRRPLVDSRQHLFCTMWVNYARMGYQAGVLTEEILHDDIFGPAFQNEPMRKWWTYSRRFWSGDLIQGRLERKFVKIIEEEYSKAVLERPSIASSGETPSLDPLATPATKRHRMLVGTVVGAAIGIALGSRIRQRH